MPNDAFKRFFQDQNPPTEVDNSPISKDDKRIKGRIIKLSEDGWGFISSKEIKFTRIFFHWTSLRQDTLNFVDLKNGMEVEFTPHEVQGKGYRAHKICVIPPAEEPVQETQETQEAKEESQVTEEVKEVTE